VIFHEVLLQPVPFFPVPQSVLRHDLVELFELPEGRHMRLPVFLIRVLRNEAADPGKAGIWR